MASSQEMDFTSNNGSGAQFEDSSDGYGGLEGGAGGDANPGDKINASKNDDDDRYFIKFLVVLFPQNWARQGTPFCRTGKACCQFIRDLLKLDFKTEIETPKNDCIFSIFALDLISECNISLFRCRKFNILTTWNPHQSVICFFCLSGLAELSLQVFTAMLPFVVNIASFGHLL